MIVMMLRFRMASRRERFRLRFARVPSEPDSIDLCRHRRHDVVAAGGRERERIGVASKQVRRGRQSRACANRCKQAGAVGNAGSTRIADIIATSAEACEDRSFGRCSSNGQVAQLVEQRTENPCVGGSIPPLATNSHL